MIICKTKRWGNSLGIIIPKEEVQELDLQEDQNILVEITKKENPLKGLFGFGKNNKITREEFVQERKRFESKWV